MLISYGKHIEARTAAGLQTYKQIKNSPQAWNFRSSSKQKAFGGYNGLL